MGRTGQRAGLRGLAAGLAAVALAPAGAASAADWSSSLFFSQRFDVDTNVEFDEDASSDPSLQSRTNLGLSFIGRTDRTTLRFAPGLSYSASTEGGATFDSFDDVNPRFRGSVNHAASERVSLSGSLSVIPRLTNSIDPLDDDDGGGGDEEPPIDEDPLDEEFVTVSAVRIDSNASGSASVALDRRSNLSLFGNYRRRDFTRDIEDLAVTQNYGGGASLGRTLDGRTSVSGSLRYTRFETLETFGADTDSLSASLGLSRRLAPDFSVSADGGVTFFETTRTRRTPFGAVTESEDNLTLTGGFDVSYGGFDTRDFDVSFGLSQGLVQDSDGEITNRSSARVSLRQRINAASSFGVTTRLSFDNPVASSEAASTESLSVSSFYSYRFAEAWNARVGYSFRARTEEESDVAFSNRIFLQISRNFSLD